MTVICVDLSSYQTGFDFAQFKAGGGLGVVLKASEGLTVQDVAYAAFREQALAAGLALATYHFIRPGDPAAQANWYLDCAQARDGERVVCDYEDPSVTIASVVAFFQHIQKRNPTLELTLYSGHLAKEKLGNTKDPYLAANTSLWLAQYTTGAPSWPSGTWPQWSLWQKSDTGRVPGFAGNVDINEFNGSDESFLKWMGPSTAPVSPPAPEPAPPVAAVPVVTVTLTSDRPVTIKVLTDANVTLA